MTEEEKIQEYNKRYQSAAHAMQAGVSMEMELGHNQAHTPKHLRVGVNSAMVEHSAIAKILIEKGVFTELEYMKALAEGMEREAKEYEERLSKRLGTNIHLV